MPKPGVTMSRPLRKERKTEKERQRSEREERREKRREPSQDPSSTLPRITTPAVFLAPTPWDVFPTPLINSEKRGESDR